MPGPEALTIFLAAALALSAAPGPDNLFVLTQSALYGRLSGLAVTLGLCSGLVVHTTAVALGVAAIFAASEVAFTVVKLLGAAYLLYLAWQALRAGRAGMPEDAQRMPDLGQLYRRGIVMNLTNPKVAIFFLAFLPQFADPAAGPLAPQLMLLGALFIVAALLVFGAISWGAGFLGEWLAGSRRAQIVLNRMAAAVFVALALRLVLAQR